MANAGKNTMALASRYVFGVNADVSENISFADDDNLAYVAGHSIVLVNRIDKRQRFLPVTDVSDVITAYTSGGGKRLVAIAERGEQPLVHVFDLRTFRRKKTFSSGDGMSSCRDFISLQFSQDEQLLLTLTGSPDFTLSIWQWSKAKLVATTQVSSIMNPMYKCSFSPIDSTVCCVTGKDTIKFYRTLDGKDLRILQENFLADHNFVSHCWMRAPDDHVLAGTDNGKILLFRSGEFVCNIPYSDKKPIWSIVSIPGGFVAGSGPGTFLFFNYDEARDQALFDNQFSLANVVTTELSTGMLTTIALSPNDENICAITSDGQLLSCNIVSFKTLVSDNIKPAVTSFHAPKAIVGMDTAVSKPLVVTCSLDCTLRVWNIQKHELELMKQFPEEMLSISIHPNGMHVAVGFSDKLRIFHLLESDLKLCVEVTIKACKECRFSKSGNILAAAHGNIITLIDVLTGEKINDLRGHNSKVRSLSWLDNGCQLVSCGQDGAVYSWDLDGMRRIGEYLQKGIVYTAVSASTDTAFTVGQDRSLCELSCPDLSLKRTLDLGVIPSHVQFSGGRNLLFCGTADVSKPGHVRSYVYPVTGDYDEYSCVSSQITRMKLCFEDFFLIITDDMGCVVIMELKDKQDRYSRLNATAAPVLLTLDDWIDDVITNNSDLEDLDNTISDLRTKCDELKLHNEYQMKLKEMSYAEKTKEVSDKFLQELDQAKSKYELLREDHVDSEAEFLERLKQMGDKHQNNMHEVESDFQSQIMELVDAYQALSQERDAQVERLHEQRKQLIFSHEYYIDELTQDFELKLDDDKQTRIALEEERTELRKLTAEEEAQLEDDIDTEIESIRKLYDGKISVCREGTLKYKGENGMMKKKMLVMSKDHDEQKEHLATLLEKEAELHSQIKMLEKEIVAYKKEIKARDAAIGEKEKVIYELKKKNQELDKFKFVLDFKIRELKQQIEPRQLEILLMRDQIKNMDAELEKYHNTNLSLDDMIGVLRIKVEEMQKMIRDKAAESKIADNQIDEFRNGVQAAVACILDPPLLKDEVEKIAKANKIFKISKAQLEAEMEEEFARHKGYLQLSMQQMKEHIGEASLDHVKSNNFLMSNNLSLISEINNQREMNQKLKNDLQIDIGRVRSLLQAKPSSAGGNGFRPLSQPEDSDAVNEMEAMRVNKAKMEALRLAISRLSEYESKSRVVTKEILPPIDNINARTGSHVEVE